MEVCRGPGLGLMARSPAAGCGPVKKVLAAGREVLVAAWHYLLMHALASTWRHPVVGGASSGQHPALGACASQQVRLAGQQLLPKLLNAV